MDKKIKSDIKSDNKSKSQERKFSYDTIPSSRSLRVRKVRKVIKPSSDILKRLKLKYGANKITYQIKS